MGNEGSIVPVYLLPATGDHEGPKTTRGRLCLSMAVASEPTHTEGNERLSTLRIESKEFVGSISVWAPFRVDARFSHVPLRRHQRSLGTNMNRID